MSNNDDIEKLLREVDANLTGTGRSPAPVVPAGSKALSKNDSASSGSGVLTKALIAAAICGGLVFTATFFLQWLPLVDNPLSSGLGAAVGAFLTALVLGRRRRT
jgi:hypothetical protein